MNKNYTGSCLCGNIKLNFSSDLKDVWFCHCSQCRKNYGMYGAFIGIERNLLIISDTHKNLQSYNASKNVTRTFCNKCGSSIAWNNIDEPRIYILAGLIDKDVKLAAGKHIYTENKGGYYEICDSLKQYKTIP